MTINEIQDLIKFIAKAGVTEVEIEKKDFKITIKSEIPKKKGASAQAGETVIQVPMAAVPAAQLLPLLSSLPLLRPQQRPRLQLQKRINTSPLSRR